MIAERLELETEKIDLPPGSIQLREHLAQLHPVLNEFTYSIAVDLEYKDEISEMDQPKKIAVMPPFAGG